MSHEIWITGLGTVGAFGLGRQALAAALAAGEPKLQAVDRSAGYHRRHGARSALLAGGVDLSALVPAAQARRMSPPGRFMVAAARLALADAGLASDADLTDLAVSTGTAFGPVWVTEQLLLQIFRQGPEQASPALFTESVASAPAAQMALAFKARGASQSVTQREASDLVALAEGARWLATGRADRVLVGVVEEMTPLLHAVLDRFRALARPAADGREVARPFDARRSGALAAEGATALLLERPAGALARGARPLCRLLGAATAFDPSAPEHDWGDGAERLAGGLQRALARAETASGEIDRIVSGASGTRRGDRLEAATLRAAWAAQELPPVVAPKATVGEYGGGFLAAAVLAAAGEPVAPLTPEATDGAELGVAPHPGPLPPARRLLVSALASGGGAAWLVLGGPDT